MKDYYLPGEERFGRFTSWIYAFLANILKKEGFYDFVIEDLRKCRCSSLLDVGTGPGDIPVELAKYPRFRKICAIDPSTAMIGIARRRAGRIGKIELGIGSSRHVPFHRKFDVVMSALSYHHWAQKAESLRYLGRFLKKGGELRIYEYNGDRRGFLSGFIVPSHVIHKVELYGVARQAGLRPAGTVEREPFIRISLVKA